MTSDLAALVNQLQSTLGKMEIALGGISEAIVWTGEDGRIQWSNATFDQLIEQHRFVVLGAPLLNLLPLRQQGQTVATSAHPLTLARTGQSSQTAIYEFHRSTTRFLLEIFSTQVQFKGQQLSTVLVIRDVTEQKQIEQRQAIQFSVTRTLAQAVSLEEAIPRILQAVCEGDGWEVGALWHHNPSLDRLCWQGSWHHPTAHYPGFEGISRATSFGMGEGLPGRVWLNKHPVWITPVADDPNFPRHAIANREHLQTGFAFPILSQGNVIGVLEFFSPTARQPDDALLLVMLDIGSQISQFWQRKQAEFQIQEQLEELSKLNAVKDEFLSTVSHELRTPIANMRMAIELLKSASTVEKREHYLEILKVQCLREAELINDLLDLQRLEATSYCPMHQTIQLHDWLAGVVEPFQSRVQFHQQRLRLDLSLANAPLTIDCTGLERIVVELLNNACKYTPEKGDITLSARYITGSAESGSDASTATIILAVSNQASIPAAALPHIFEKFYRVAQTDIRRQGGTGLGLALVQKLVEQMHGKIEVESAYNRTTFTVQLPSMLGLDMLALQ